MSGSLEENYYHYDIQIGQQWFTDGPVVQTLRALGRTATYCYRAPSPIRCNADGEDATQAQFVDEPGTVIDIPAGRGQAQAGVLEQLCSADSSPATCTFSPTSQVEVDSPTHVVGPPLINKTPTRSRRPRTPPGTRWGGATPSASTSRSA